MAQNPETLQTCANIGGMVAHMAHRNWWLSKALRALFRKPQFFNSSLGKWL